MAQKPFNQTRLFFVNIKKERLRKGLPFGIWYGDMDSRLAGRRKLSSGFQKVCPKEVIVRLSPTSSVCNCLAVRINSRNPVCVYDNQTFFYLGCWKQKIDS
ncbi:MAG: hypothetical protein ACXVBJ_15565, partial [Flavisolibacter sp.]